MDNRICLYYRVLAFMLTFLAFYSDLQAAIWDDAPPSTDVLAILESLPPKYSDQAKPDFYVEEQILNPLLIKIEYLAENERSSFLWFGNDSFRSLGLEMKCLNSLGYHDEVLCLGDKLFDIFYTTLNSYEFLECMPEIVDAVKMSSLEPHEKLVWVMERYRGSVAVDEDVMRFMLPSERECFSQWSEFLKQDRPQIIWSETADLLLAKLNNIYEDNSTLKHTEFLKKENLYNWHIDNVVFCLRKAGRYKDIEGLLVKEAEENHNFIDLVDYYIEAKQYQEAENWIEKGIYASCGEDYYVYSELLFMQNQILFEMSRWEEMLVLDVVNIIYGDLDDYYDPDFNYARASGLNDKVDWVEKSLIDYCQSGNIPWQQPGWPLLKPRKCWLVRDKKLESRSFPKYDHILSYYGMKGDREKSLYWYHFAIEDNYKVQTEILEDIVWLIEEISPDDAFFIWARRAEEDINSGVNYWNAMINVRMGQAVCVDAGLESRWQEYVSQFCAKYSDNKPLIEEFERALEFGPLNYRRQLK